MTIKKTTASRSTVTTQIAAKAAKPVAQAAPSKTRAQRPDDPRSLERLADVASRTAAQLDQFDQAARKRVGLDDVANRGAASNPYDAFGDQATKGSNRSSPLDRLRSLDGASDGRSTMNPAAPPHR